MAIKDSLNTIFEHINQVNPQAKLVVVGKKHSAEQINKAIQNGAQIIAENKWQDAKYKLPDLLDCEKHFIGHLQTNKAKYIVKHFDCIQSVDSLELAEKIDQEAAKNKKIMPIMIQVNISHDPNKYGVIPKYLKPLIKDIEKFKNIEVIGLMAITSLEDMEKREQDFKAMRKLFDEYKDLYNLTELSMGMSSDYKLALQQGSTMIRIGQEVFN